MGSILNVYREYTQATILRGPLPVVVPSLSTLEQTGVKWRNWSSPNARNFKRRIFVLMKIEESYRSYQEAGQTGMTLDACAEVLEQDFRHSPHSRSLNSFVNITLGLEKKSNGDQNTEGQQQVLLRDFQLNYIK